MMNASNIIFISHGGGPMPLLGDPGHQEMVDQLNELRAVLPKPSAILVISAHWEDAVPAITSGSNPELIYDYYGFPQESYEIQYPAPGDPELASRIHQMLGQAGIESRLDYQRGFDHGMFVPLKMMFPQADIPVVQLSLASSLDPELHLAMGEALKRVDWDNLLVVGSGFSFHNMRAFFSAPSQEITDLNQGFEHWLLETCAGDLSEAERRQRLVNWEQAPGARFCHPREEHLLPLHVCYGLAGSASSGEYPAKILGKESGMFHWQLD
ncbi:MAG: class III extradiol ring-cleavage dioxygenase [Oceanospirillum sp.]|nr:class III extradiol ring-cleavage dioxygenase [Oceanospirillum sp.]